MFFQEKKEQSLILKNKTLILGQELIKPKLRARQLRAKYGKRLQ
jgi:hypothetical protein